MDIAVPSDNNVVKKENVTSTKIWQEKLGDNGK